ncbi:DUF2254 domain-containing protein [Marisediminicola sp. LYQ134]|uniref:DUF2254 domain-containing protein n=1 Tax=Marisediminicola sp. LYQ134 TaxID=3391061 RepID=UPI003982EBAC
MRTSASTVSDSMRTQLWPVPLAAVVVAFGLGLALPYVDSLVDQDLSPQWKSILFDGGSDAAKSVMETIAGSLITVTALTFSLTVVTLQLASSQFSPRLLRTFSRDRVVHNTLALFLATFTFSLTVLRSIRVDTEDQSGLVPRISVSLAFLLAIASVITLVGFLAHLAKQIRVETMLKDVHSESTKTVERVFPDDPDGTTRRLEVHAGPGSDARSWSLLEADTSGFLLSIDTRAVLAAAVDVDAVIVVDAVPGDSLVTGVPFGRVIALDGREIDRDRVDRARRALADAITTGFERTSTQDVGFGLQQLLDVASRALSPGINDPTTAVHAIGHVSSLLVSIVERPTGAKTLLDDDDRVRVVVAFPTFDDLLDQAMRQLNAYAMSDPRTAERVIRLLREVGWRDRSGTYSEDISRQLGLVRAQIVDSVLSAEEKRSLVARCDDVTVAIAGDWTVAETPRSRP